MSFEPYKAPGIDNITPMLLQQSLEKTTGLLTRVLRGCIALGYTPRQWLKTKIIFIPKLELRGVCIGAFLDVEGALNWTSREAIRKGAEEHGIPKSIID